MTKSIKQLLEEKSGIRLDIGCGAAKQEGFVGLDARALPGVDIVWDVLRFPWPLPEECAILAMSSHLLEHIPPFQSDPKLLGVIQLLWDKGLVTKEEIQEYVGNYNSTPQFIAFMNEVWRVMKVGGQFAISVPHGHSEGFLQDPSHCNMMNEARWAYFDPFFPNSGLWGIYRPLPWQVQQLDWNPAANMEVVLKKRSLEEVADV